MRCHEFTVWSPFRCKLRKPQRCRHFDPERAECTRPWLKGAVQHAHA
ncbi:TPA_asm: hypothetical protein GahPV1_gp09 [Geoglobus ahangari pleomorphic virus 1]|uniref:Uncharacterized protein n=2 Tax=root TaxID=1 RepID=A0A0F7IJK5_9EURY|nr:hypothetical protein [Geoglobus ahangari]AKG92413.1 hypothetical protein GAH_00231 [Geoglobus ahangari]